MPPYLTEISARKPVPHSCPIHAPTTPFPPAPQKGLSAQLCCRWEARPILKVRPPGGGGDRAVLEGFLFLLRTALKDRPKGPPTANRQLPPTTNRHQPPTTNCQPRPPANRQPLSTATNHPSPTANCHQPPLTAANHQPPTANRQSPPAANRQSPPTMVEHMSYTRSFLKKPCSGTAFFFR